MGNKYYIKFGISNRKNAGSKAMRDVMHLLNQQGYHAMPALPVTVHKGVKLLIDIPLMILTVLFFVRTRGTVLYIIPSNAFRINLLAMLRSLLGFKMICFINDVEQLRMPTSKAYAEQETASIALADCIMAPNKQSMEILRKEFGIHKPMAYVGVWDYLSNYTPSLIEKEYFDQKPRIAYAGNLKKSPFIYSLDAIPLDFALWGDGAEKELPVNVHHEGAVMPDELPPLLNQCHWGLVWDGPYINTCDGQLGTYLRFNNAHKCGLYLAAGLPLIVWKQSGMAHFVESHQVGICVESLRDLPSVMASLTKEQYLAFRKNVLHEGELIRTGHYFLDALKRAERKNLTLLWRKLQPMEAGKDVVLTPYYLGQALDYNTSVVCGYENDTFRSFKPRCLNNVAFVHCPLGHEQSKRIPQYLRYLLTNARRIDLLMCFHRRPETLINIAFYRFLNWHGKVYVKLDTEQGKEWSLESKNGLDRWLSDMINRLFIACCNVISCETKPGYNYLMNHSPYTKQFRRKLVIMPNAFDDEELNECGIQKRPIAEKENIMLTVGRLGTAQKNTEMLLRALEKVDLKNWKVYMVGTIEKEFEPIVKAFFEKHSDWQNKIILTGPEYNKGKLWEFYNRSRVFLLTSTWEGTCIVLSEAQKFHNYLVTTKVGDAYSLVGDNRYGTFIPQDDDNALATVMQAIIDGTLSINVYSDTDILIPDYSDAIQSVAQRIRYVLV